ncbi:MAG: type I 3-dehydroquinate dehydratase, partial [Thermoguttaceae bacterium]
MICVSIACGSHKRMISEHVSLADDGVRLVELRLDFLRKDPELGRLLPDRPTAVVATVRRPQDGGSWRGNEEKRMTILRSAIAAGVEFVDLEEDVAYKVPRFGKTKRIISFHDTKAFPENLEDLYKRMVDCDPDVVKIAVTPGNVNDIFKLMHFTREKNEGKSAAPVIGIAMGETGVMSRILAKKFGSPFTYATFSESRVIAPGLLEYSKLRDFYRFEDINRDTEVYGVIGDPIAHSLSPLVHNAGFASEELNKVYLPIRLLASDVHDFVAQAPS